MSWSEDQHFPRSHYVNNSKIIKEINKQSFPLSTTKIISLQSGKSNLVAKKIHSQQRDEVSLTFGPENVRQTSHTSATTSLLRASEMSPRNLFL